MSCYKFQSILFQLHPKINGTADAYFLILDHLTPIENIVDGTLTISLEEEFVPANERKAISVDPTILREYIGGYEIASGVLLTITQEDNRLLSQGPGGSKIEIFPLSETVFFLKIADVRMIFDKNDNR